MHVNRTPARPCIRDTAALVARLAPHAEVYKAIPIKHFARRLRELATEEPRFAEEWPVVLESEKKRRQRIAQPLTLTR